MKQREKPEGGLAKNKFFGIINKIGEGFSTVFSAKDKKKVVILNHFAEDEVAFRNNMEKRIKANLLKGNDFFGLGKVKKVSIFQTGESSVVLDVKLQNNQRVVFKTCLTYNDTNSVFLESHILSEARKNGASVVGVIQKGDFDLCGNRQPYEILQYEKSDIDFSKTDEKYKSKVLSNIGVNLAKIHKTKGKGFGSILYKNGEFVGLFDTFTITKREKKKIDSLEEENLIDKDMKEKIHKIFERIKTYYDTHDSCWLHYDINKTNVFFKKDGDIVVFDADNKFGNILEDIAIACLNFIFENEQIEQSKKLLTSIISGYERSGIKIDREMLMYTIIWKCLSKGQYRYKKGIANNNTRSKANGLKLIELAKKLSENPKLLDQILTKR